MRFTEEQKSAIEVRGSSVLLSAAAGSGKTATLVERIMRLVSEGVDVDSLLVVTFTRAAAAGMREKLNRALSERAAAGDESARRQLIRLERALITTLHAFCADFLRENFEVAEVDPAFSIMDEADEALLLDDALDEAIEHAYQRAEPSLEKLDYGRGPAGVREMAAKLMKFLEARPDGEEWLERALAGQPDRWINELTSAARSQIEEAYILLMEALEWKDQLPPHYVNALWDDAAKLDQLLAVRDYETLRAALTDFKFVAIRGKNAGYDPEAIEHAKSLRDSAKKRLKEPALTGLPLQTALSDAEDTLFGARALAEIAREARELLEEAKRERGALTYADLEIRTLRTLRNPDAAQAQRERFSHVFVDEYQDTSDVQEAILDAVSRPDNRFMVGDVKQSIYRFREAEPGLFLARANRYRRQEGGKLLLLTRNFRSDRGILDFTNAVFSRLMAQGDIPYDDAARLRPGSDDMPSGETVDIHVIYGSGEDEFTSGEREGLLIAGEIRRMMAEDKTLRYRDFAILTRQGARAFDALMPMLVSQGIPCYADGAEGYFDALEIRLALSLLRLVDQFHSDEELIGVLRSPVCLISLEELAQIRLCRREGSYADAVLECAGGEGGLAEKLRRFLKLLESWRLRSGSMGLDHLVRAIVDESGIYAYAGALPGGAQRQSNLDQLVLRAGNFDRDVSGSLNRFLAFADGIRKKGSADAAHVLGENDDVVRLMTVHHSKGLEYRVVFGALLGTNLRKERREDSMLCHRDLGLGLMRFDPLLRSRRNTLSRAAIQDRINREELAEELRILYVLFTRAQKKLILVGSARSEDQTRALWRAAAFRPMLAGSLLNMTMASLGDSADSPFSRFFRHDAAEFSAPDLQTGHTEIRVDPEEFDPALAKKYLWKYPCVSEAMRPLKLTVSGLLRNVEGPGNREAPVTRPLFLQKAGMSAAEKGTAYHRALQLLDLTGLAGLEGRPLLDAIRVQLDALRSRALLTEEERETVRPSTLTSFLDGETGRRMRSASLIRRELPFNVLLPASRALTRSESADGAGEILVQGTIDCCFVEDGRWILLDYKTSHTDDLEAVTAQYKGQLELYAEALHRITGMEVGERILCLISMGMEIRV